MTWSMLLSVNLQSVWRLTCSIYCFFTSNNSQCDLNYCLCYSHSIFVALVSLHHMSLIDQNFSLQGSEGDCLPVVLDALNEVLLVIIFHVLLWLQQSSASPSILCQSNCPYDKIPSLTCASSLSLLSKKAYGWLFWPFSLTI